MDTRFKKDNGIFETPTSMVSFLLTKINLYKIKGNILEPSAGSGNFIKGIVNQYNSKNIYAIERDINLYSQLNLSYSEMKVNLHNGDYLSPTPFDNVSFDLIIGNPPYSAKLRKDNIDYFIQNSNFFHHFIYESSVMFLIKSLHLLNENGFLCFILPATLLRVNKYEKLRTYIKSNFKIVEIINLEKAFPEVGYELICLIVQKTINNKLTDRIILSSINPKNSLKSISYHYFSRQTIFPLYLDDYESQIIEKIEEDSFLLKSFVKMPRGRNCKIIKNNYQSDEITVITTARNIQKYKLINHPKIITNDSKNLLTRIKPNTILIQNLAYKIVATITRHSLFINDTINFIEFNSSVISVELLTAIINSKLMTYYLQNKLTNRARLNVHMDLGYVGYIPIKKNFKLYENLIKKYVNILEIDKNNKPIREEIEKIIFDMYNIHENEIVGKYLEGKKNP